MGDEKQKISGHVQYVPWRKFCDYNQVENVLTGAGLWIEPKIVV